MSDWLYTEMVYGSLPVQRQVTHRLMLVVKWTFDELYFLSLLLFLLLLLLSIVISYLSFMSVI